MENRDKNRGNLNNPNSNMEKEPSRRPDTDLDSSGSRLEDHVLLMLEVEHWFDVGRRRRHEQDPQGPVRNGDRSRVPC